LHKIKNHGARKVAKFFAGAACSNPPRSARFLPEPALFKMCQSELDEFNCK
jgi:hypothetical protein